MVDFLRTVLKQILVCVAIICILLSLTAFVVWLIESPGLEPFAGVFATLYVLIISAIRRE